MHSSTISAILCKTKDRWVVEYTLSNHQDPLGIATLDFYDHLPEKYAQYLPNEVDTLIRLAHPADGL